MLQIRNDFEIIEELRIDSMHLRQIATRLKLVPSTVMRILKKLSEENIVDYKKEGKNNRYFLKGSLECFTYLLMVEEYKKLKILQNPAIRRISKAIESLTNGELVILFGSYAKNMQVKESDIDVYVETIDPMIKKKLSEVSDKLGIKIGNFDKNSELGQEIIKNHIILRNSSRFYELLNEKNKFY